MSPERTQAYRHVMQLLDELGPSKLQDTEQERIRMAADTLIFSSDPAEAAAREALGDVDELCAALVDSGRWEPVTAERLERELRACGPDGLIAAAA